MHWGYIFVSLLLAAWVFWLVIRPLRAILQTLREIRDHFVGIEAELRRIVRNSREHRLFMEQFERKRFERDFGTEASPWGTAETQPGPHSHPHSTGSETPDVAAAS